MRKVLVCYANYSGEKGDFFDTYTEKNFREYCGVNDVLPYIVKDRSTHDIDRHPTWMSWKIISDLIDSEFLRDGDLVSSIDADTCIVKMKASLFTSKSFGYAIDSCNTHCMGFYSIKVDEWSKKFVKNVLDEERYHRLKNTPIWEMWNDQASVYSLFGIMRHSWLPFPELPHNGWGSSRTPDMIYEISEILERVEIMPTEWNVTHVAGENFNEFFIIPTHKKDTVIRHFAGGQKWNKDYFLGSENAGYTPAVSA